jgi:hypothetical protein
MDGRKHIVLYSVKWKHILRSLQASFLRLHTEMAG